MGITYSKLFNTLPDSTIWAEPNPTRICWITMLAMADQFGRVYSSIPGLANRARISLDETEVALATFFSPDRYSRTPDHEGRRIAQIDGGWRLLNHSKFRELQDEEAQKARKAKNARDYRDRHRVASPPSPNITAHHPIAEAEAEAEAFKLCGQEDLACKENSVVTHTIARFTSSDIARIYDAYPRKVGKGAAQKQILAALNRLDSEDPVAYLLSVTKEFAKSPAGNRGEFTPHPATFFNQSRYLDDPEEWEKVR